MNYRLLTLFIVFTFSVCGVRSQIKTKDSLSVMAVLFKQQAAWNSNDIGAFMEGYWRSDRLVFSGAGGPIYGWEATKMRYEKNYPDAKAMGRLKFTILDMINIEKKSIQMQGRYDLKRDPTDSFGYFTLIWKKINGVWYIISDHTSAAQ